jgi:hypothetical protein
MTQVFAGINHRLSEEYGKIELPTPEAKARYVTEFRWLVQAIADVRPLSVAVVIYRLLADARYLHQKLSALKNVTAPSSMLETVVMEKSVTRKDVSAAHSNAENARGGANVVQRSKGFVSSFKSPVLDKALPTPTAELGSPVNGIGRKGDINGRVKARLSSLMSPPASSGSSVPGEVPVEARDRDGAGLLDVPKNDPSREVGITGPAIGAVAQRMHAEETRKVVSGEPAGTSVQEDAEARPYSPASYVDATVPHQSVDMTKPVMGLTPEN